MRINLSKSISSLLVFSLFISLIPVGYAEENVEKNTYLSDLSWQGSNAEKNLNAKKEALKIKNATYEKGLGVKSSSELRFQLDGKFNLFQATIGPDDASAQSKASLSFTVKADEKEIYQSGSVSVESFGSKKVDVSVKDAKELVLITSTEDADLLANWTDALLTPAPPAPTPIQQDKTTQDTVIQDEKPTTTITEQVEPLSISTVIGTAPILPSKVNVLRSDDTTTTAEVKWNSIDPASYAKAGDFHVEGTLAGSQTKAQAKIIVAAKNPIVSLSDVLVSTKQGVTPKLPDTVKVTRENGSVENNKVTWDTIKDENIKNSQSFILEGALEDTALKAKATVLVEAQVENSSDIVSIYPANLTTGFKVEPDLPKKVIAKYKDGTNKEVSVTWDAINPQQYAREGKYTVFGKVSDTDLKASLDIVVLEEKLAFLSDLEWVSATTGNGTVQRDKSSNQGPMIIQGTSYPKGLGVHANSEIVYNLNRVYQCFEATIGPDDFALANKKLPTSVVFQVFADGRKIYDSGIMVTKAPATEKKQFHIDVIGVKELKLVVSDAGTGDGSQLTAADYANWANAFFEINQFYLPPPILQKVGVEDTFITTKPGVAPEMPGKVNAIYEDSSKKAVTVTWDKIDPKSYQKAGKFEVSGAVVGSNKVKAKAIITVSGSSTSKEITKLEPVSITTQINKAPSLPTTVKASYSDNSTSNIAVTWDKVDPKSYQKAGKFEVLGTVNGTTLKAKANVEVTESSVSKEITKLEPVSITTQINKAPSLPATIKASYSDSSTSNVAVTWDKVDPKSYQKAGKFEVLGTVNGTTLKAKANVEVTATGGGTSETITKINPISIESPVWTAPILPKTVSATLSNGKTKNVEVKWASYDWNKYMKVGTFAVEGKISGTTITAKANIKMVPVAVYAVPVYPSTKVGKAPSLPTQVQVEYSDGTKDGTFKKLKVTWDSVPSSKYKKEGKFTVSGKISGIKLTAQAIVTVKK